MEAAKNLDGSAEAQRKHVGHSIIFLSTKGHRVGQHCGLVAYKEDDSNSSPNETATFLFHLFSHFRCSQCLWLYSQCGLAKIEASDCKVVG